MELELISFKLCPFVQRSVITLLYKEQPYKITHIDLFDPPDWFKAISPSGMVPVLRVDDNDILFESAVINEFIDDITPPHLQPDDALQRAKHRGWIEFGSTCMQDVPNLIGADSEEAFETTRQGLLSKLARIETELGDGPFFAGSELCLVDTSWAPMFMRLDLMNMSRDMLDGADLDKVRAWSEQLLALPAVQDSVVDEFAQMFRGMINMRGGEYAKQILLSVEA